MKRQGERILHPATQAEKRPRLRQGTKKIPFTDIPVREGMHGPSTGVLKGELYGFQK